MWIFLYDIKRNRFIYIIPYFFVYFSAIKFTPRKALEKKKKKVAYERNFEILKDIRDINKQQTKQM